MNSAYSKIEEGRFILLTENTLYPDNVDVSKIPKQPDFRLETGLPLPMELRSVFPRRLIGLPIQEIDPYYYDKETFVVVNSNWTVDRFSSSKSIWLLDPFHTIRWHSIRILSHSLYRFLMHVVIIIFTFVEVLPIVFMNYSWLVFCIIFAAEVILKIIAYGFLLTPFTYLRNPWNWLDFTLTNTGWFIGLTVDRNHIIQPLRSLRLLHMGTVSRLSFNWIFRSVRLLKDLLLYVVFIFVIFTLVALHTYNGITQNKCVKNDDLQWRFNRTYWEYRKNHSLPRLEQTWYYSEGSKYVLCGNYTGASPCPEGYTCKADTGISSNYGFTNFDNFGWAGLQVARLMTVDLWDQLFLQVRNTLGPWNIIYFLVVVIFGGHLVANLVAAHIAIGYGQLISILEGAKPIKTANKVAETQEKNEQSSEKLHDTNEPGSSSSPEASPILDSENESGVDESAVETQFDDEDDDEVTSDTYATGCDGDVVQRLLMMILDLFCACQCFVCCDTMRRRLNIVVNHWAFISVIVLFVGLNTIGCLMLSHSEHIVSRIIVHVSLQFGTYVFLIEAVLKMLAWTPKKYFTDPWNQMDFIILLFCLFNELLFFFNSVAQIHYIIVFRCMYLAKWWPNLRVLVNIAGTNTILLIITTVTFASVGRRLFNVNYVSFLRDRPVTSLPDWNFRNNFNAFGTVIRVLCGEWTEPFWHCHLVNGWSCAPYFLTLFIVGNLVVINVFVAMLLRSLQSHNLCDTGFEVEEMTLFVLTRRTLISAWRWISVVIFRRNLPSTETANSNEERYAELRTGQSATAAEAQFTVNLDSENEEDSRTPSNTWCPRYCNWGLRDSMLARCPNLRNALNKIFKNRYCSIAYTLFIILMSIPLALEDITFRRGDYGTLDIVNDVVMILVTVVFLMEVVLKYLCYGWPKKWLNKRWCQFDLAITLIQLTALIFYHNTIFGNILINLRPLKLISRVENLRVVATTLLCRACDLVDTVLACGFCWLVAIAISIYVYSDIKWFCIDHDQTESYDNITFRNDCLFYEKTWINSIVNFNNMGSALLALLQVALSKGWLVSSQKNISEENLHPDILHAVEGVLFGFFLIYGVMSPLALIIRSIVKKSNYQKQQTQTTSYIALLMTKGQKKSYDVNSNLFFTKPIKALPLPNENICCSSIYAFISTGKFDIVVILVLVFNAVTLMLNMHSYKTNLKAALQYVDNAFISFFVFETTLKLLSLRALFFQSKWNIYDLVVNFLSLTNVILKASLARYITTPYLFATYYFAILRVIRLARFIKGVRYVGTNLLRMWPAFFNVFLFVSICAYVASLIGMGAFMKAEMIGAIDRNHNFQTFASSLLVVSQLTLTANWMGILVGLLNQGYIFSFIFVTIYVLWSVLLSVYFGTIILLEYYSQLHEKSRLGITDQTLNDFSDTWKILDPDGTGYIPLDTLADLLRSLPDPLQIERPGALTIAQLDLPIYAQNQIAHDDLLRCLLRRLNSSKNPGTVCNVPDAPAKSKDEDSNDDGIRSYDVTAEVVSSTLKRHREEEAIKIQKWWRSKRDANNLAEFQVADLL